MKFFILWSGSAAILLLFSFITAYALDSTPEYFLDLSLKYYQEGQFAKSIEAAQEALKLRPHYDLAYNNICAANNGLKLWDKAIEACEKAVKLNPNNQLAINNLLEAKKMKAPLDEIWKSFWEVVYLTPHTFNFVDAPKIKNISFVIILYLVIFLLTASLAMFLKPFRDGSILKAFILACTIAGILFAARMDYTWLMWWKNDVSRLSNLEPAERFALLEAYNVHGFAEEVKKLVPDGEGVQLFTGDDEGVNGRYEEGKNWAFESYCRSKIRYHLLPVKLLDAGNYIAVFRDNRISMDHSDNSLKKNGVVIAGSVELVKAFGNDTFLYKIEGRNNR